MLLSPVVQPNQRGETGVKVCEAALYNLDAREDTLQRVLAVNTHGSSLPLRAAWRMFPFSCDEKGLCVMGTQRPQTVDKTPACFPRWGFVLRIKNNKKRLIYAVFWRFCGIMIVTNLK